MTDKELLRALGKNCYNNPSKACGPEILLDIMTMNEIDFLNKAENMTLVEFYHYAGLPVMRKKEANSRLSCISKQRPIVRKVNML